ncbi:MAG TPA: GDP-mannose 4,6-dehydratase [bacterium]|nr:GDP-mannose 4,6-dehydratase [bacterium]
MRLLVTGGCGFIGSNFVNYIMDRHKDWHVSVLDSLTYAGYLENIREDHRSSELFRFIQGDIRDRACVENAVEGIDVVVHFAAESHVSYSFIHADLFADVNVRGTSILCETVVKKPVKKLILISSSEVYGDCQKAPMDEDHALLPKSPYAGSKAAADRIAYSYFIAFGIPLVILRPFNNYGPAQHTEKVIPRFITRALQGLPLSIHDSGLQTRDWLYVEDHATAIERVIGCEPGQVVGETINIGTGREMSILTIAQDIVRVLGTKNEIIVNGHRRPGQVWKHISSTDKAKRLLGWEARTPFDVGLEKSIRWYVENRPWWNSLKKQPDFGELEKIAL